jgi:hypothetical protein
MTDAGWRIVDFTETQMSAERVREKRRMARERYDKWQTSLKSVNNAAANDPARPAPPARKGGGQVGGNGAGLAEPAPARIDQVPPSSISGPTRRDLARMIREAPNPSLRRAYISIYRKAYGSHLTRPSVACKVPPIDEDHGPGGCRVTPFLGGDRRTTKVNTKYLPNLGKSMTSAKSRQSPPLSDAERGRLLGRPTARKGRSEGGLA